MVKKLNEVEVYMSGRDYDICRSLHNKACMVCYLQGSQQLHIYFGIANLFALNLLKLGLECNLLHNAHFKSIHAYNETNICVCVYV